MDGRRTSEAADAPSKASDLQLALGTPRPRVRGLDHRSSAQSGSSNSAAFYRHLLRRRSLTSTRARVCGRSPDATGADAATGQPVLSKRWSSSSGMKRVREA
jgi:hypothetical protein